MIKEITVTSYPHLCLKSHFFLRRKRVLAKYTKEVI